jgi:hypothetical protein
MVLRPVAGEIRRAAVEGCFSLSVIARFLGLGESEGRGLSIRHRPLLEHLRPPPDG